MEFTLRAFGLPLYMSSITLYDDELITQILNTFHYPLNPLMFMTVINPYKNGSHRGPKSRKPLEPLGVEFILEARVFIRIADVSTKWCMNYT